MVKSWQVFKLSVCVLAVIVTPGIVASLMVTWLAHVYRAPKTWDIPERLLDLFANKDFMETEL